MHRPDQDRGCSRVPLEIVRRHLVLAAAKHSNLLFQSCDLCPQRRDLAFEVLTGRFLRHGATLTHCAATVGERRLDQFEPSSRPSDGQRPYA